jgi:hypothetical protein
MQKKIAGIYIKVPCEHNVGSCSYSVCTNKTAVYPDFFGNYNASQKCPTIPPAIYSVSNLVVDVKKSLPSIADGEFKISIDFASDSAGHVGCLHLGVNLKN